MDPRVAWIQPEQKGPANTLWMYVWETSQGGRTLSAPVQFHNQNHNQCVNYAAAAAEKNGAPSKSSGDGAATAGRSGGHHGFTNGINASCKDSSTRTSDHPAEENTVLQKAGSASSSSSQESGTDVFASSCLPERTIGANVSGNLNQNVGGANMLFGLNDGVESNGNLHHLPQEHQTLHPQQVCARRLRGPPPHSQHPGRRKSDNKASTYGMTYLLSICTHGGHASTMTPWKTMTYSAGIRGSVSTCCACARRFPVLLQSIITTRVSEITAHLPLMLLENGVVCLESLEQTGSEVSPCTEMRIFGTWDKTLRWNLHYYFQSRLNLLFNLL